MGIKTMVRLIGTLGLCVAAAAQGPPAGRGRAGRFGEGDFGRGPDPGGARLVSVQPGTPGRIVKNAPYSADVVTESAQMLADGNRIRQTTTGHFYRDSEGRTRQEQSLGGLSRLAPGTNFGQRELIVINDPVAGLAYALDPSARTASRSPFGGGRSGGPPPDRSAQQGPPADRGRGRSADSGNPNVKTESLGRETIEGVAADGTRTVVTIPAGQIGNDLPLQIVSETWYSPELQVIVLNKQTDPRIGETSYRLTNISRAEPARSLFEPPADYKVVEGGRRPGPGRGQTTAQ